MRMLMDEGADAAIGIEMDVGVSVGVSADADVVDLGAGVGTGELVHLFPTTDISRRSHGYIRLRTISHPQLFITPPLTSPLTPTPTSTSTHTYNRIHLHSQSANHGWSYTQQLVHTLGGWAKPHTRRTSSWPARMNHPRKPDLERRAGLTEV
ncbi:hypothetical protein K493DRAFT_302874 [Basidiobolus meristosporus CBS 931.73]|uniref:Uncharacterized protein n=1 Tax=Basidiobolus meristosporus CBS 931.73 TaxID=1314790 RepID=A0A1Y1Y536_9FUNG|nr:hypothetical protein K493DRAFT_302874 [Basidiobolus meristosporus CBS 931.73]|eukprot:ORX93107.1 hypothetical protein K493DRAFT_302874 [Basidiobolus meristosporus CBS 931.73]